MQLAIYSRGQSTRLVT